MKVKTIALVAHDNLKASMGEWAAFNWGELAKHKLICTGTTGRIVETALQDAMKIHNDTTVLHMTKLRSGPLGGDQQLGALIAEGKIDVLIFFWDPMQQQPHDVDIKALLRLAVLYNIPHASNRSTADFIISSPLYSKDYARKVTDYSTYLNRKV